MSGIARRLHRVPGRWRSCIAMTPGMRATTQTMHGPRSCSGCIAHAGTSSMADSSTADVTPTNGICFGRMLNEELERKYGANLISGNQALASALPSRGNATSKLTSQSMPPMSAQAVLRQVQDIDSKLQGPCSTTSRLATFSTLYPLTRMRVRMADKLEQVRQRLASLHGSEAYQFSGSGNLAAKNAASGELASWYSGISRDVSMHGYLGR
jgi:hypothetical protein